MKPTRRELIGGASAAAMLAAMPAEARMKIRFGTAVPTPPPVTGLERLAIDAGGYCLNNQVDWYSLSGLRVIGVDTIGCYSSISNVNNGRWTQLINNASTPWNTGIIPGYCPEIKFAPSQITRFGAWFQTNQGSGTFDFIASENSGTLWRKTGLTCDAGAGLDAITNFGYRWCSGRIIIDPNNPNVCYAASQGYSTTNKGVHRTDTLGTVTTSGGWTKITDVPDPLNAWGCAGMAFDVSGGTIVRDGITVTKNIIIPSSGNGVYLSTDGGDTFTQISDPAGITGPAYILYGDCFGLVGQSGTYDGWYWCTTSVSASVHGTQTWKYKIGSGWTHVLLTQPPYNPGELPANACCLDQLDSGDIIFVGHALYTARTTDNGGTFIDEGTSPNKTAVLAPPYTGQTTSTNNVTWLTKALTPGPGSPWPTGDNCQGVRDPLNRNRMFVTTGVGCFYMDWPSSGTLQQGQHYVVDSLGIQMLETDMILSPPGSTTPVLGVRDRQVISPSPGNLMATNYFASFDKGSFGHCYCLDYASNDPSVVFATISYPSSNVACIVKSTNYGITDATSTWTYQFTTSGYEYIQSIAVLTSQKLLYLGRSSSSGLTIVRYSTDAGVTLTASTGIDNTHWTTNSTDQNNMLAADRVTPDTYYAYVPSVGCYYSTDAGATFNLRASTNLFGNSYLINLQSVPGNAGHLIISSSAASKCYRSTNGGANWTDICTAFSVVYLACVGAAIAPGGTYPRIVVTGEKIGTPGFNFYYSDDAGTTWNLLFLSSDVSPALSLRSQCIDGNDAKIFYFGAGHPGQGGYKFTSLV